MRTLPALLFVIAAAGCAADAARSPAPAPAPPAEAEPISDEPPYDGPPFAELEAACARDDADACFDAGNLLMNGTEAGPGKLTELMERACLLGVPVGCPIAGFGYLGGDGVPEDRGRALWLFERGCEGGSEGACHGVVTMLDLHVCSEVHVDDVERYQRRCAAGTIGACEAAGFGHHCASRHATDGGRAVELFTRACEGGSGPSCHMLGLATMVGEHVPRDRDAALRLFQKACELDIAKGCEAARDVEAAGSIEP